MSSILRPASDLHAIHGQMSAFVDVALPLPIHRTFTYRVDGRLPPVGGRVLVPFGRSARIGWVVAHDAEAVEGVRPVIDVLEWEPSIGPELLRLGRWIGDYYIAPLGLALRTAVPRVLTDSQRDYLSLADVPPRSRPLRPREERLIGALEEAGGRARATTVRAAIGGSSIWPEVRSLQAAGYVKHEVVPPKAPPVATRRVVEVVGPVQDLATRETLLARSPRQREALEVLEAAGGKSELSLLTSSHGFSRSVVTGLEKKGVVAVTVEEVMRDPFRGPPPSPPTDHELTRAQTTAVRALVQALDHERPKPFLLHGVTGSGKTRVYIELLREVLERGLGGIVLVPEISLTPQTVSRFRAWFGDQVAVLHSGLSDGERYDAWRQIRAGAKPLVVGARSALFAPLPRLGAIVVDEEHDGSYKQSEAPRYHGRDLAVVRASEAGAVCCLGTATPSLESWANASSGKFTLLALPERVGGRSLPPVKVIDLRRPRRSGGESGRREDGARTDVLSRQLTEAVRSRLTAREQVILLLNRRGYSSFVQCRECGDVVQCEHCSISLTYHHVARRVVCHHCRYQESAPERCRRCGSRDLSFRGLGTEQVERVVAETFGAARIARMDVDTTSGKWSHHEILGRFKRGEIDILLGTQMIAKGLDFPNVTLVGVINADVGLHLPDFRASERTFQLLSQVAGRAGRGSLGGEVMIQTAVPEHYAVQAAVQHDYEAFARRELEDRRTPSYPPHVRLVNVVVSSPDQSLVAEGAEAAVLWVRRWLQKRRLMERVQVVGPAPSPIERLHGRWRWHFFLRSASVKPLGEISRAVATGFKPAGADVRVVIDRDPTALL